MNYYEELGLSGNASAEEIKEAYRSLVRLLHPDTQSDPQLQQVAERQIKKLNKIYEVLSDGDRRRNYDRDLAESAERAKPIIIHAPPPPRQQSFLNKSSASWIIAVAVFAILLVWMASRPTPAGPIYVHDSGASIVEDSPRNAGARPVEGSELAQTMPQRQVLPPQPAPAQAVPVHTAPVVQSPTPQATTPSAQPAPTKASNSSTLETDALRTRLAKVLMERDDALAEVSRLQSRLTSERNSAERLSSRQQLARAAENRKSAPAPIAPEPRPDVKQPAQQTPVTVAKATSLASPPEIPVVFRHPIAGSWFYRKPSTPSTNKDLYPPEFIETVITEEDGQLRGTYHARYHAPNRPVSPEVSFHFNGKLNGESGSLPWNGTGGSKGEVTFKLMADRSLRVDWTASQLGSLGFYRGTAVLVKKAD